MSEFNTIPRLIAAHAQNHANDVAMREKNLGLWEEVTWSQYFEHVHTVAHALLALGVGVGDRVAIHSENRREWLYGDVGAAMIRAASVGLYPTNPAAEVLHVLRDSGAKVVIAEDQEQVDKALEVIDQLTELKHIIYVEPRGIRGRYTDPRLLFWDDFYALGLEHREKNPRAALDLMDQATPEDLATLVYTSGTTGPPKGAMLSTGNISFVMNQLSSENSIVQPPASEKDLIVSYLPLSHVAERLFTTWLTAATRTQVHFAESIETVTINLREIQPTILFGVPRIWEKIVAGVSIRMAGASRLKKLNFKIWMGVADRIGKKLVETGGKHTIGTRLMYAVGWVFLYRPLRERLGLSNVRYAASGAAPIAPEVLRFFMGLGLKMYEVYGMTENSAIATANFPGRVKLGTVGEVQPGTELKLSDTGEILTRHPGTFMGYWNNPTATAETIDADGWLHTGDVGEWVDGTHIKITDRLKDIIITAGGKNISPSEIENSLKASPFIKEAIVVGDRRKYLTALIGIELDTVGDWAQKRKLPFTTYRDLSEKPEVIELISKIVNETNTKFASVETIKKFKMLPKELDHEEGELTATQKVKRSSVVKQFEDLIESMYAGAN